MTHGILAIDSWAGRTRCEVEIVGETAKRYRIRAITNMRLGGHGRMLAAGDTALVPKHAVTPITSQNFSSNT